MTENKRFTIDKSNIIPNGYVIFDENGEYAFTPQMYRKSLINTCKALNKLNDKNKQLKKDNLNLQEDLDYFKAKNSSLETGMFNLERENEQLKHRLKKFQSKYDKSKTDEVKILVETENTVLLDKEEFQQYIRRHNELKRHNKRRKQKNKKYRNELKKRLKEICGLKEFIAEDLSGEDKILKGFIEEYL